MLAGKKKTFDLPETIDFSGIQAYLEIISKKKLKKHFALSKKYFHLCIRKNLKNAPHHTISK